jgi:hypothetical protein
MYFVDLATWEAKVGMLESTSYVASLGNVTRLFVLKQGKSTKLSDANSKFLNS